MFKKRLLPLLMLLCLLLCAFSAAVVAEEEEEVILIIYDANGNVVGGGGEDGTEPILTPEPTPEPTPDPSLPVYEADGSVLLQLMDALVHSRDGKIYRGADLRCGGVGVVRKNVQDPCIDIVHSSTPYG